MIETAFEDGEVVPTTKATTPEELSSIGEHAPDDLSLTFDFNEKDEQEIEAEVQRRVGELIFRAQAEAIGKLIHIIADAKKPRQAAYAIAYACGNGAMCGGSATSIAKKLGISKQAFEQESERLLESLDIRKNPLMKSEEASKNYAHTNYRKPSWK